MSKKKTMKAVAFMQFGEPEVLQVMELPVSEIGRDEVLVKISHTSVNPVDWKIRRGYLTSMLKHNFPVISGWDASGTVVEAGADVKGFSVGDRVAAYTRLPEVGRGTYAEYIALPTSYLAKLDPKLSFEEAASLPLVALTAYQALTEYSSVGRGSRVLVLNGSGGVGSIAIQLAKNFGAQVIATTGTKNLDYVKSLGADQVVDYTHSDFKSKVNQLAPEGFDFVLDAVGGENLELAMDVVKKGGQVISIVDTPDQGVAERKGIKASFHFVSPNGPQLQRIVDQVTSGSLKAPAFTVGKVTDAIKAHKDSESHRTRGKVVLEISF